MMRLFIADDSENTRKSLAGYLSDIEGIEIVGEAGDWAEATDAIQELVPDVAILDIQMPNGNGVVPLRAIKRSKLPPKIIMFTNCAYPEYRQMYTAAGADYFFDKCSEYNELTEVLKQLIQDSALIKQTLQAD